MKFSIVIALLTAGIASAATNLQFVPATQNVIPLADGNVLVVGAGASIVDSAGLLSANLAGLGSGKSLVLAAAVDANGDIWIAGQTDSDDFPLVHPLFAQKVPYKVTGFVAKLDPHLNVLFSTFLGGTSSASSLPDTMPTGIAVDNSGSAYVAGHTGQPDFPTTGPVLGTGTPGPPSDGTFPLVYTFVSKISQDGSKLLYSVFLGGDQTSCPSSSCLEAANTSATSIAVDANDDVTLAGGTTASNFPVTPNAYQTACNCSNQRSNGFIARISADASRLLWATFIGKGPEGGFPGDSVQSIALDASGNVFSVGTTHGGIVASPGALQANLPVAFAASGFAAKLNSDGTKLLYGTNLGGSQGATLTGFALDAVGNVWITGNTTSPDFPGLTDTPASGLDFALELNADASALQQIFHLVPGTVTQPPAFDSSGNLLLLAFRGNLLRLDPSTALTTPGVFAVANAAILTADGGVAPGEIATFFGVGLGPSDGIVAAPNSQGVYPTRLGGVHVVFDVGLPPIPAPLLYVGPNQINFQVPFRALGGGTITVTTPTMTLPPIQMPGIPSIGVFHRAGSIYAAALNQNLSVNSASNPAKPGSIISLFTTGFCGDDPFEPNGVVSEIGDRPTTFNQGIVVTDPYGGAFQPLPILYFGFAPGIINGVCQLNVQLPLGDDPILVINRIAVTGPMTDSLHFDASSNAVQIYAH